MSAVNQGDPVAIPSLEDLIVEMGKNYPPELRNIRAVLPDGQATSDFKSDPDKMARLAELAGVNVEQTAPGEPDHEIIADVAIRGQYVSFVVLDADGVPSSGAFSVAQLAQGADDSKPLIAATPTVIGGTGQAGAVGHGTARVPTVARDGELQAPPGVPANIDDLSDDETVELLTNPPQGVDPRAVAQYVKGKDEPSEAVLMAAFGLGLYRPNVSGTGASTAQAEHAVDGPGTTPTGGNSLPGPDPSSTSSTGSDAGGGDQGDEFDQLSGSKLDEAVTAAGIDASTGGTKADGGLTASEKRQALRDKREAASSS